MGSSLNSEITQEWELATKALEKYGSVLAAVNATTAQSGASGFEVPSGDTIAKTSYNGIPQNGIDVIKQMMANSDKWSGASESERVDLKNQNAVLGNSLKQYGIPARIDNSGTWYVGSSNKYKLYDMYSRYLSTGNMGWLKNPEQVSKQYDIVAKMKANSAKWSSYDRNTADGKKKQDDLDRANVDLANQLASVGLPVYRKNGTWYIKATNEPLYQKYHSGGIVGTKANVKQDEVLAVLQKGEAVLDEKKQNGLYKLIDFASVLSERLGVAFKDFDSSIFGGVTRQSLIPQTAGIAPSVINNPTITIGDTYISGANEDTIRRHQEISRNMVNEILDTLHIRK